MNCSRIGYDMTDLNGAPRCPECGTTSWRDQPKPDRWRGPEWLNLVASCIPLLAVVLLHLMPLLASLELERWPNRDGMDDPKSIPQ